MRKSLTSITTYIWSYFCVFVELKKGCQQKHNSFPKSHPEATHLHTDVIPETDQYIVDPVCRALI